MTVTMYDSVTVSEIPADAPAVAGYVGGRWPTYATLVARFPHAHHLSIAVNATERTRCLDIENGDAVPAQAPLWLHTHADRTAGKPVLYGSASAVAAIVGACAAAGIKRDEYLVWSAHYTGHAHICAPGVCGYPQADGTQWTDHALGRNLDESFVSDAFFATAPPADPHRYLWFDTVDRHLGGKHHGSERAIVKEYDTKRARPSVFPGRLKTLRDDMSVLAARLETVMEEHDPSGKQFRRAWRRSQLAGRAAGRRYV